MLRRAGRSAPCKKNSLFSTVPSPAKPPQDAFCLDLKDQYMFGSRFLVAPVMEAGIRSRKVYLPAGTWKNLETDEFLDGGRMVLAEAPLEIIPVFEKIRE